MEDGTSSTLLQHAIGSRSDEGDAGDQAPLLSARQGEAGADLGCGIGGSPCAHWTRGGPAPWEKVVA